MLRNVLKLKNSFIGVSTLIAMVAVVNVLSAMSLPVAAVSADLKLEISGIQCDLEAIYGGNDPATVIVPTYCDNAPETPPPVTTIPSIPPVVVPNTGKSPLQPSLTALILKPLPPAPALNTAPKPSIARASLPEVDRNEMSLVAKSAIDAVIATLLIAILFVAFILSPWLSKLHK